METVTRNGKSSARFLGIVMLTGLLALNVMGAGAAAASISIDPERVFAEAETGQMVDEFVDIINDGTEALNWSIPTDPQLPGGASDPLIGFDFARAEGGNDPPQHWTRVFEPVTVENAPYDTGEASDITVEFGIMHGGLFSLDSTLLADGAVPQYDYDLTGMTGYVFNVGARYFIEVSGLVPNAPYQFWHVAYATDGPINNIVEVSDGDVINAFEFSQFIDAGINDGRFIVNDTVADDTMDFNDLAMLTNSSGNGTFRIEWQGGFDIPPTLIAAFAVRPLLNCKLPEWLSLSPTSGTVNPGDPPAQVTVSVDATGLAPGTYVDAFCVESNDPAQPVMPVLVELEVTLPANFATIEGTVESAGHCGANPRPLEGATVQITGADGADVTLTTDANGFYDTFLPDDESPLDIDISAPDHLSDGATVTFVGGDAVIENFTLLLDAPCATAGPGSFEFDLLIGEDETRTLTIGNVDGNTSLVWDLEQAPGPAADPRAHFPDTPRFVAHNDGAGVSDGIDPSLRDHRGDAPSTGAGMPGAFDVPAFSTTGFNVSGYVQIDAADPDNFVVINPTQPNNFYAGTFVNNDLDNHYVIASTGPTPAHTLGTIDVATGDFTEIGVVTGGIGDNWAGLAWDHSTGTLYGVASNTLFTIDLNTLEAAEVGLIDGPGLNPIRIIITMDISPEGLMYAIDIVDNVLIAVDKTSGDAAVIGPLGLDPFFAQDMAFDQSSGILYWPAFLGNGDSRMTTIDLDTGAATEIGPIASGDEMLSFAIAIPGRCADPEDVPWLSVAPDSGTTPPGGTDDVDVTVNATGLAQGTHKAFVCISSNDPVKDLIPVFVTLNVTNPNAGFVEGTVTSAGHCGATPRPLKDAQVTAVGQTGTFTALTDENGFYEFEPIDAGESPLEMNVTAEGHFDGMESGVVIEAGETTMVDFDLVLDAPCATVDRDFIATEVGPDGTAIETLTIGNLDGAADLAWTIDQAPGGESAVDPRAHFPAEPWIVEARNTSGTLNGGAFERSADADPDWQIGVLGGGFDVPAFSPVAFPSAGYVTLDAATAGPVTVISTTPPNSVFASTFIDNDLNKHYMLATGGGQLPQGTFGYVDVHTGDFENLGTISGDPGGNWSSMAWDHTTNTLYAVNVVNSNIGDVRLYTIDPGTLVATEVGTISGPNIAPNLFLIAMAISPEGLMFGIDISDNVLLAIDKTNGDAEVISPTTGVNPNFAQDMDFDHSDGTLYWASFQEIVPGVPQSQIFIVDTETGALELVGELENQTELNAFAIAIIGGPCATPEDVPWLSVDPDSGTTGAGGISEVDVIFTDTGLEPGEHEAVLCIASDDPAKPRAQVPVTLTVLDQEPAELAVNPDTLDFGEVIIGGIETLEFAVLNTADANAANLSLKVIDLTGDAEFSITGGSCEVAGTVGPGDSCTVEISFVPGAEAPYSGEVTIVGSGQMATVTLAGEGAADELPPEIFSDRFQQQ